MDYLYSFPFPARQIRSTGYSGVEPIVSSVGKSDIRAALLGQETSELRPASP
jgi:hypothetical protein